MSLNHSEEDWMAFSTSIENIFDLQQSGDDFQLWSDRLANHINYLIDKDFNKLLAILYRLDVNEIKLRQLILENSEGDAGKMIAGLIIERQLEKMKSRRQFKPDADIAEDEKW
jgi:hypothetical protein